MTKTTVPIWAITAIVATLAIITSVATWGTTQAQSLPTVAFPTINMTVDEPASSNDVAIFQVLVRMNQTSNSNVTVDYATTGVVARPGEDYRDVSGTLRFPAGTTEAHIRIPILGDDLNEGADRLRLELTNPSGANLGAALAQITIIDTDEKALVWMDPVEPEIEAPGAELRVVLRKNQAADFDHIMLVRSTDGGTSTGGSDFTEQSQTATFKAHQFESEPVFVEILDDDQDEPDESVYMTTSHQNTINFIEIGPGAALFAWIIDDDPGMAANLEMVYEDGNEQQGYFANLQWDHDDAEGYLLESRDGTSGAWNCIVAGAYSNTKNAGTSVITTTRGGPMAASSNWHFRVRLFNSEKFSYAGEATCDSSAQYGYIFSTVDDQGYNLSDPVILGPVSVPAADATQPPDAAPTGLAVTAGAKHRDVEITWDAPPDDGTVTGFAIYRKWRGASNAPYLCLYWSTAASEFITSYTDTAVAAYESDGNKNQYIYRLYPLNSAVASTPLSPSGCDDYQPTSVPRAMVTATLELDTVIVENSNGDLEYINPPAPTGLTLTSKFSGQSNAQSIIIARWESVGDAAGYKVRYRKVGTTDWLENANANRSERKLTTGTADQQYNNCTGVPRFQNAQAEARGAGYEGRQVSSSDPNNVWCARNTGSVLVRTAENWPKMYNAGPGAPNDDSPRTKNRMCLLEHNRRYEVQVATCANKACTAISSWSGSRYATAPSTPR